MAVEIVLSFHRGGYDGLLPKELSRFAVQAEQRPRFALSNGGDCKDPIIPYDGGGVPRPWQLRFPGEVASRVPASRDLGFDAGAIQTGAPPAWPILGTRRGKADDQKGY